jgi:hypothetical protein
VLGHRSESQLGRSCTGNDLVRQCECPQTLVYKCVQVLFGRGLDVLSSRNNLSPPPSNFLTIVGDGDPFEPWIDSGLGWMGRRLWWRREGERREGGSESGKTRGADQPSPTQQAIVGTGSPELVLRSDFIGGILYLTYFKTIYLIKIS